MNHGPSQVDRHPDIPARPSTDRTPLWLLDFDGTINPLVGEGKLDRTAWDDWKRTYVRDSDGRDFPVAYSPSVVSLVVEAIDAGIDVRLLSDWRGDGPLACAGVGLPSLPVVDLDASGGTVAWHKLQAARAIATNRPLLWTDDDIFRHNDATRWLKQRRAPTTHLSPPPRIGLTHKMVREIRAWIAAQSPIAAAPGKAPS